MTTLNEADQFRAYLGDGVYATFDGYQVILTTERLDGVHWVAVEPQVLTALNDYWALIVRHYQTAKTLSHQQPKGADDV